MLETYQGGWLGKDRRRWIGWVEKMRWSGGARSGGKDGIAPQILWLGKYVVYLWEIGLGLDPPI